MFTFNSLFPDATDEQKWEQIRIWRDKQLVKTDWTQIVDSTADKTAWAEYRQTLRDLPNQGGNPEEAKFPTEPK